MADLSIPAWMTQLGASVVPALALLGFVVNRADRINDTIKANDDAAMLGIKSAKEEAEAALTSAMDRFDSRHEALRREVSTQIGFVLERINSLGDTMARREDLSGISARIDGLNSRMDKMLDR